MNILSIAESHREKSKSQQDLKRQFEEFSRNLSFRRSGGRKKRLEIPEISVEIATASGVQQQQHHQQEGIREATEEEPTSPGEAAENGDTVGNLNPVFVTMNNEKNFLGPQGDIDFPQGFNFKSRPSIWQELSAIFLMLFFRYVWESALPKSGQ